MSIRKLGSEWLVDVCDGSRRVRRIAKTLGSARHIEGNLRRELAHRRAPTHGLEAALDRYLDTEAGRLKDERGLRYKARFLLPFIHGKTLSQVQEVAEAIKRDLGAAGFKPATINRRLAILRRLCNLAFREWGWLDQPVGQRVRLLSEHNARHIYLTPKQVEALAARCRPGVADFIRLAAYTGLRRGELLGLTTENVSGTVLILDTQTKTGRPRLVPVPEAAQDILGRIPLRVTNQTVREDWERARVEEGLPTIRVHDLRHTYASWLAQANVALTTIGALLGHTQASTTKRYAHLSPEALEKAVAALKFHGL